jgi:hypothetical protein
MSSTDDLREIAAEKEKGRIPEWGTRPGCCLADA